MSAMAISAIMKGFPSCFEGIYSKLNLSEYKGEEYQKGTEHEQSYVMV